MSGDIKLKYPGGQYICAKLVARPVLKRCLKHLANTYFATKKLSRRQFLGGGKHLYFEPSMKTMVVTKTILVLCFPINVVTTLNL